jgi:hypothetical protein
VSIGRATMLGISQLPARRCQLYLIDNPLYDRYRLVLLSSSTRLVFAERAGHRFCLPRLSIPRWTRAAEQVQQAIDCNWGIKGIVLDFLGDEPGSDGAVLVELMDGVRQGALPTHQSWANLCDIHSEELTSFELDLVETLFEDGQTGRGPFSRFGWIEEAQRWIGNELGLNREPLTSEILQLNAGANHALVRLGRKAEPPLWLKAVVDPSDREFVITKSLALLAPEYLPQIVASREGWKAWCMKDAGRPLLESFGVDSCSRTVHRLAELQIASIDHAHALLATGCRDLRYTALRDRIPQMMELAQEAMEYQSSGFAPRLGVSRFRRLSTRLEDACVEMADLNIPDTLMHGDISLDNILVGGQGCVFTDWAQALIGNPFVTFERLCSQIIQDTRAQSWLPRLADMYRAGWRSILSEEQINRALYLARTVTAAVDLLTQCETLRQNRAHEFQIHSGLRAMARRLDRAVEALELNQDRCA